MYKMIVLTQNLVSGDTTALNGFAANIAKDSPNTLMNTMDDVFQIIILLVILAGMIVLAHFTTKWVGKSKMLRKGGNLDILESRGTGVTSSIQLVRAGSKYFVIGVTKEHVTFLTEVDEDSLDLAEKEIVAPVSFEKIMERFKKRND